MSAFWRWTIFAIAAAVAAVFGLRWTFGRGIGGPRRAAGAFLLLVVAGWVAGAGGAALRAWAPQAAQKLTQLLSGGGSGGQAQGAQAGN